MESRDSDLWPDRAPEPTAVRASDAERERTAQALRRHHLDGRLDTDELQDRIGRAYAARTTAELAALLADLPEPDAAGRPAQRSPRRAGGPAAAALLVAVLLVVIAAAAAAHGHPGPFPVVAVLLVMRLARRP